jgi:hypothetical protein
LYGSLLFDLSTTDVGREREPGKRERETGKREREREREMQNIIA